MIRTTNNFELFDKKASTIFDNVILEDFSVA